MQSDLALHIVRPRSPAPLSRPFTKNHKRHPAGGDNGKVRGSQKSVGFILWGT